MTFLPINFGDGRDQRLDKKEDVKAVQKMVKLVGGKPGWIDGKADRKMLDAVFDLVGSPAGGSYISGKEYAILLQKFVEHFSGAVDVAEAITVHAGNPDAHHE